MLEIQKCVHFARVSNKNFPSHKTVFIAVMSKSSRVALEGPLITVVATMDFDLPPVLMHARRQSLKMTSASFVLIAPGGLAPIVWHFPMLYSGLAGGFSRHAFQVTSQKLFFP